MAMALPSSAGTDIMALLRSLQPQHILMAGQIQTLADVLEETVPTNTRIDQQGLDDLRQTVDQLPVYDVIVLLEVIENLDKAEADALLSRLRDLHARHLFVFVPMGEGWSGLQSHWHQTDLLALGFSLWKTYTIEQSDLHLYRFELDTYKATPEWLNSKYWANPELFGKYRW